MVTFSNFMQPTRTRRFPIKLSIKKRIFWSICGRPGFCGQGRFSLACSWKIVAAGRKPPGLLLLPQHLWSLCSARKNIHKAPCSWRTPPPSRGRSRVLPVCKSYQQCKKGSARLLLLGVYPPPPAGAGPRYYPYAKVISSAISDLQKVLLHGVYPPPAGAGPRYYPYAKVINSAQADPHMEKVYGLG